jgi:hypothetical protein
VINQPRRPCTPTLNPLGSTRAAQLGAIPLGGGKTKETQHGVGVGVRLSWASGNALSARMTQMASDPKKTTDPYALGLAGGIRSRYRHVGGTKLMSTDNKTTAWSCDALKQGSAGGNDPADCGWPVCGCDPYAAKVIQAIEEAGYHFVRNGSESNVG